VGDYEDDAVLVAALRHGDEAAFAWLLDRHGPGLARVARRHVADDDTAADVVAETWLAVIRGIDGFEGRSSVQTWLYRIVLNRARTRGVRDARTESTGDLLADDGPAFAPGRFRRRPPYRHHWSRPPAPWEDEPDARLAGREVLAAVADAITTLPERQRSVFVLRDVEGWSAPEVCEVLEVSEGNQRVLLHRARARVRQALEDRHEEGGW